MSRVLFVKHRLNFSFRVRTSRGPLFFKQVYFIHIKCGNKSAIGECAPFAGLSPEFTSYKDYEAQLEKACKQLESFLTPDLTLEDCRSFLELLPASLQFGFEMGLRALMYGWDRLYKPAYAFETIPTAALVWMDDFPFMKASALGKAFQGSRVLKIKVGSFDFEKEVSLIKAIQTAYPDASFRLDANGAFSYSEAAYFLDQLKDFNIEFIEQPVKSIDALEKLAAQSEIPIALDEALTGDVKKALDVILQVRPQVLVLKPSLIGGACNLDSILETSRKIENLKICFSSALETPLGRSAICQMYLDYKNRNFKGNTFCQTQGLGTRDLYELAPKGSFESDLLGSLSPSGHRLNLEDSWWNKSSI